MRKISALLLLLLLLSSCNPPWAKPFRSYRVPAQVDVFANERTVVHVSAPCATLTPFDDYRDFMRPGTIGGDITTTLVAHPSAEMPFPDLTGRYVLPPAEATLVFDNSDNCD